MIRIVLLRLISLIASCCILVQCKDKVRYDTVILGGEVYNYQHGHFDKLNVGIRDGKVVLLTKDALEGEIKIDATGQYVYPGLIDAHCHFVGYAKFLGEVNLVGSQSYDEMLKRIEQFRILHPEIKLIYGRGWDQNLWPDKNLPTNDKLNQAFGDLQIVLTRIDGHAALVSDAVLRALSALPELIEGGSIVRLNGKPTGLLIDNALNLLPPPAVDYNAMVPLLQKAQENCFALGITNLAEAGLNLRTIYYLDSLQKAGILQMPIYAMLADDASEIDSLFKIGFIKTDVLSVRSIKVYADGALGSRGALLLAPYQDDHHNFGLQLKPTRDLNKTLKTLAKHGYQVNVHAIGDSANRLVLSAMSKYLTQNNDMRWRIEHAQIVNRADFHYFKDFNIIPSVQPTHATSDMPWAEQRIGPQRIHDAYAYQSLLQTAGIVALGTDFPVEDIDPRKTFYAAVARKDAAGNPENGFLPDQKLSRVEALNGMTIWAAFAQFQEKETGSIEVKKWADLVISPTNLLECSEAEILKMPIHYTFVHGQKVYEKVKTD